MGTEVVKDRRTRRVRDRGSAERAAVEQELTETQPTVDDDALAAEPWTIHDFLAMHSDDRTARERATRKWEVHALAAVAEAHASTERHQSPEEEA